MVLIINYLAEHGGQHGVASVHVADVLVEDDADEPGTGQRSAALGAPTRARDAVVVVGRQEAAERGQPLTERRVAQVVAEPAELAEGRRGVAGQRLLVGPAAGQGTGRRRRRRLHETGHVDVVQSLRYGTGQSAEDVVDESAQLAFDPTEFRAATISCRLVRPNNTVPVSMRLVPVSIQVVPVSIHLVPVSIQVVPVFSKLVPVSIQVVPVFSQLVPVSIQMTPVLIQMAPVLIQLVPVSIQMTPVSIHLVPVSIQMTPVLIQMTPVLMQLVPISIQLVPFMGTDRSDDQRF